MGPLGADANTWPVVALVPPIPYCFLEEPGEGGALALDKEGDGDLCLFSAPWEGDPREGNSRNIHYYYFSRHSGVHANYMLQ